MKAILNFLKDNVKLNKLLAIVWLVLAIAQFLQGDTNTGILYLLVAAQAYELKNAYTKIRNLENK